MRRIHCQCIHFIHTDTQNNSHLVYKSTCATGTVTVHTEINRFGILKENDFSIFTSYIYHRYYIWIFLLNSLRCCNHFLNKRDAIFFGKPHSNRTRYSYSNIFIIHYSYQLFKHWNNYILCLRIMSLVL